jgi:uncharacterized protein (DUF697 family)
MQPKSRRLTNAHSGVAAVVAFVTQPIPAADELIVVPIHYTLCLRLARARGVSIFKLPWRSIQRIIWYGAAARLVLNVSVGLVPVVGMFSNSITAIALTEYLSRWMDDVMSHPETPPPDVTLESMKALFTNALKRSSRATPKDPEDTEGPAPTAKEGTP